MRAAGQSGWKPPWIGRAGHALFIVTIQVAISSPSPASGRGSFHRKLNSYYLLSVAYLPDPKAMASDPNELGKWRISSIYFNQVSYFVRKKTANRWPFFYRANGRQ